SSPSHAGVNCSGEAAWASAIPTMPRPNPSLNAPPMLPIASRKWNAPKGASSYGLEIMETADSSDRSSIGAHGFVGAVANDVAAQKVLVCGKRLAEATRQGRGRVYCKHRRPRHEDEYGAGSV